MQRILIIVLVLAVVLAFMVTYVVRFNEQAVVTTFGKADKTSVVIEPGLRFKLPYPFQKVTSYDKRLRLIQSDQETQQTAEKKQVILATFLTWRVSDPLEFYKRFGGSGESSARDHYHAAELILKTKLRAAASAVSLFKESDLVSPVEGGSKLDQLEDAMLQALKGTGVGDSALSAYGIEAVKVGISGIGLPSQTTQAVFGSMKAARDKIANEWSARGESEANTIRSNAESSAKTIKEFADTLASGIRKQGDLESAQYYSQMNQDPQLAVFLQNMQFMRNTWGRTTTLVIPTTWPGFDLLPPDSSKRFGDGRPPVPDFSGAMKARPRAEAPTGSETKGAGSRTAGEGR